MMKRDYFRCHCVGGRPVARELLRTLGSIGELVHELLSKMEGLEMVREWDLGI